MLESARYHAKAGMEARGRQIAEGWRFADWAGQRIDILRWRPNWKAINVAEPFGQFHSVKTTD